MSMAPQGHSAAQIPQLRFFDQIARPGATAAANPVPAGQDDRRAVESADKVSGDNVPPVVLAR